MVSYKKSNDIIINILKDYKEKKKDIELRVKNIGTNKKNNYHKLFLIEAIITSGLDFANVVKFKENNNSFFNGYLQFSNNLLIFIEGFIEKDWIDVIILFSNEDLKVAQEKVVKNLKKDFNIKLV